MAVVRGSGVNQDGKTAVLTAPNGPSQEAVIRAAGDDCSGGRGVHAGEYAAVEAHGTGTPLGDPIEVGAVSAVIGEKAGVAERVWIGSGKSNIGHAEAAAGVVGLMKSVDGAAWCGGTDAAGE